MSSSDNFLYPNRHLKPKRTQFPIPTRKAKSQVTYHQTPDPSRSPAAASPSRASSAEQPLIAVPGPGPGPSNYDLISIHHSRVLSIEYTHRISLHPRSFNRTLTLPRVLAAGLHGRRLKIVVVTGVHKVFRTRGLVPVGYIKLGQAENSHSSSPMKACGWTLPCWWLELELARASWLTGNLEARGLVAWCLIMEYIVAGCRRRGIWVL